LREDKLKRAQEDYLSKMQDRSLCQAKHKEMPRWWNTNAKAKGINLKEEP